MKYWTRQPYLGFGVDAHSMLLASPRLRAAGTECVRMATTESFDAFFQSSQVQASCVSAAQALEESFFLGLRLNRGVSMATLRQQFGAEVEKFVSVIEELVEDGLLDHREDVLRLTPRGRLLSNEVFEKFILTPTVVR